MPSIAIIDDNFDQSETVQGHFQVILSELESDLSVITSFPFRAFEEYFRFIEENEIMALILDEKLNDQSFDDKGPVDYKGNDLISIIRERYKELPVFTITAIAGDSELQEKYSEYDQIISRNDFYAKPEKYVPIVIRATQRYWEAHLTDLSEFERLSKEAASGIISGESMKKLSVLQMKFELPFTGFDDKKAWLDEYQKQLDDLEQLKLEFLKRLGK